jgi:hypothetical protein
MAGKIYPEGQPLMELDENALVLASAVQNLHKVVDQLRPSGTSSSPGERMVSRPKHGPQPFAQEGARE